MLRELVRDLFRLHARKFAAQQELVTRVRHLLADVLPERLELQRFKRIRIRRWQIGRLQAWPTGGWRLIRPLWWVIANVLQDAAIDRHLQIAQHLLQRGESLERWSPNRAVEGVKRPIHEIFGGLPRGGEPRMALRPP